MTTLDVDFHDAEHALTSSRPSREEPKARRYHATIMSPFGVGFGDIVQAIALITKTTKALRDSKTIPNECRSTTLFLDTAKANLKRFDDPSDAMRKTKGYREVEESAKDCVEQIMKFAKQLERYQKGLSPANNATSRFKDRSQQGMLKLQWTFSVRENLRNFMNAIAPQLDSISSFLHSAEADSANVKLELIIQRQDQVSKEMAESVYKCFLLLWCFCQTIHQILLTRSIVPRGPSLIQDDDTSLTDALGRTLRLSYDNCYWGVMTRLLEYKFGDCAGEDAVRDGSYGIYSLQAGGEFLHKYNWKRKVRPDLKLVMAMSVTSNSVDDTQCPRCGSRANTIDKGDWSTCSECDLRHRAIRHNRGARKELPPPPRRMIEGEAHSHHSTDHQHLEERELVQRDNFAFTCVQWVTFPCHLCNAVLASMQALLNHEYLYHTLDDPKETEARSDEVLPSTETM